MSCARYSLVAFDLDGTLVAHHEPIWKTLHEACGSDPLRRKRVVKAALAGEISYEEWFEHDLAMLKDAGTCLEDVERVVGSLGAVPGAEELVRELQAAGAKVVVISGGIERVVSRVFPELVFDAVLINRLRFGPKGALIGGMATPYDREHKVDGLHHLAERFGVAMSDTAFVGDGPNDVAVAQAAAPSIAWGAADSRLIEVATHHVSAGSLDALHPYLLDTSR